jgi:prepilin-type N-terminal cleavage/methylation domain-containing protein
MKFKITKAEAGFSLIELMIVVGIIGILATIAVPRMQNFRSRAMQAEANMILNNITTLQAAYQLEFSTYIGYGGPAVYYGRVPTTAGAGNACAPAAGAQPAITNVAIGFTIEPCVLNRSPRYGYNIEAGAGALAASTFTADAESGINEFNLIFPGCANPDNRSINQDRAMTGGINAC